MELVKVHGLAGFVTVEQASRMLGITVSGVHKLVKRQGLPVIRLGNSLLLKASDLHMASRV